MLQLLASYMETFSHVLEHQHGHMGSQLQYLYETAEALRLGEPSARIGSRRVHTSDSGGAAGATAASGGFFGDRRLLRETLKVKFGRDHLVSTEQVKEVQLAMSQVGKLGGRDHLVSTEQVKEVQLAMSQVGKLGGSWGGCSGGLTSSQPPPRWAAACDALMHE